ncbi:Protein of unknown function [Bacillus cereus]|nr:Protein of unknown function [Bacillus cereus]
MWKFVKLLFSPRINKMDKISVFILVTQYLLISSGWLEHNFFTIIWGITLLFIIFLFSSSCSLLRFC